MLFNNFSLGGGKRRRLAGLDEIDEDVAPETELDDDLQARERENFGAGPRRRGDNDARKWDEAAADDASDIIASGKDPHDIGGMDESDGGVEDTEDETPLEEVAGGRDRLKSLADFGARNILPKAEKQPAAEAASRVVAATTRNNGALAQAEFDAVKHLDQTAIQALGEKALPPVKPRPRPNPRVPYLNKAAVAEDLRRVQFPRDADGNRRRPTAEDHERRALIEQKIALTGLFDRNQGPTIEREPAPKPVVGEGAAPRASMRGRSVAEATSQSSEAEPAASVPRAGLLSPLVRALDAITQRISFTQGAPNATPEPAAVAADRITPVTAGPEARDPGLNATISDLIRDRQKTFREGAPAPQVAQAASVASDAPEPWIDTEARRSAAGEADAPDPAEPGPIEIDAEAKGLWRQMGAEAFEAHRLDWAEPYGGANNALIDEFVESSEFAQRVAQLLEELEPLRQRYRWEAETGRETAENLVELNIESPQLRQRLRAYLAAQREGAATPSSFTSPRDPQGLTSRSLDERDWSLFAVRSVVTDTAKVFSQEALFARDAARLEGVYEAGKDAVHAVARQVADGASLLRGLRGDRFQAGMPPSTIIDAMLRLPVLAEAKLTGADPAEIMARDAAARERLEAGVSDVIAAARAAWEDPETAASAAKAFGVETLDAALAELGRLAGGQADRTAREAELHRRLTAGEIDQASFLEARRGLAREATLDFVTIASVVIPAGRGIAGALSRVDLPRGPGAGLVPVRGARGPARAPGENVEPDALPNGAAMPMVGWNAERGRFNNHSDPEIQAAIKRADDQKHRDAVKRAPKGYGSDFDAWIGSLRGDDIRRLAGTNDPLWPRIAYRIRAGGGTHEWLMVSMTADLVDMGIGVDEILDLSLRTDTKGRHFRVPETELSHLKPAERARAARVRFGHSDSDEVADHYMPLMHRELAAAIDSVRRQHDDWIAAGRDPGFARDEARRLLYNEISGLAEDWLAPEAPWPAQFGERL